MKTKIDASKREISERSKEQDLRRYANTECTFESSVLELLLIPDDEIQANASAAPLSVTRPFYLPGEREIGDVTYEHIDEKGFLCGRTYRSDGASAIERVYTVHSSVGECLFKPQLSSAK